jgi:hypothetical protein
MVQKTQHHLIRARETLEDLFALERLMP